MTFSLINTSSRPCLAGKQYYELNSPSTLMLYMLFATAIGLPMVTNFYKISSSVSLGTALTGLTFIGMLLALGTRKSYLHRVFLFVAVVSICVVIHFSVIAQFRRVDFLRGLGSLPLIAVCLAGGAAFSDILNRAQSDKLTRAINSCTRVLLFFGLWAGIGLPEPSFGAWNKPVFPFTEPSHLAITIGPYIIFSCVASQPIWRLIYIATAFLVAALLQSTTLAVELILITLLTIRLHYALIALFLSMPIIASLDLTYYIERLSFLENTNNLTALVYLQGWQLIAESWNSSNGFGLGFQQLGVFGTHVEAAKLISSILSTPYESLNLLDGGFTLVKILSEFGVFGVTLLIPLFFILIRSMTRLHRHSLKNEISSPLFLFAHSAIFGFFFELLFRGIGYFSPTFLLSISAIWILRNQIQKRSSQHLVNVY